MLWKRSPIREDRPDPGPNLLPYKAFATEFDVEMSAAALSKRVPPLGELLEELRATTPARLRATRRAMEFQSRFHQGHELGDSPLFTLLIDHSGSMRGARSTTAATIVDIVGDILQNDHIRFEVLGFTTQTWHGGRSRQDWKSIGSPAHPGRLCDLLHIVYRAGDEKSPGQWARYLPLMMSDHVLKENIDGEALLWAEERAMRLNPTSWVCLLISDGAPVDDSTILANGNNRTSWYLEKHRDQVVTDFASEARICLGCLTLGYTTKAPFRSIQRVEILEQAPLQVFDLLDDLIWGPPEPGNTNPPGEE